VSLSVRQLTYLAAIVLAIAALVLLMPRSEVDRSAPDVVTPIPGAATVTIESGSQGLTIDDRPVFPEDTEFVRVANPGGEEPHTMRKPDPKVPALQAPLDESAISGTGGAGAMPVAPATGSPGGRIAGGAIDPAGSGPGGSDFYEPGMPPEYGAPIVDVSDEDMGGVDIVVASPEGEDTQAPDLPPEDLNPGINYPAPEVSDPGIDYPAPEDSGA
jgi:hypothetical protein